MKQRGRVLLVTLLLTGSSHAEVLSEPVQVNLSAPVQDTVGEAIIEEAKESVMELALRELADSMMIPVKGVVAKSLRGDFNDKRGSRRHNALDILAPRGTPVLSSVAGRVLQLVENDSGGLMVFATDPSARFILLYAHLDDYADDLKPGMLLTRGQVLGYVGTTGNAPRKTPHLHFAIKHTGHSLRWSRGEPVDPYPLLKSISTEVALGDKAMDQSR